MRAITTSRLVITKLIKEMLKQQFCILVIIIGFLFRCYLVKQITRKIVICHEIYYKPARLNIKFGIYKSSKQFIPL